MLASEKLDNLFYFFTFQSQLLLRFPMRQSSEMCTLFVGTFDALVFYFDPCIKVREAQFRRVYLHPGVRKCPPVGQVPFIFSSY
jgi:hypothetical protein